MVEVARTVAVPTNLSTDEANSCHKILALYSGPAQILGKPLKGMTADEFKATMSLTMAQVHLGPGYKPEHVDYVLSGGFESGRQENN
ncbi:MAG: hypothetical protein IT205_03055 [Fimbriimonadaceae bacterium]|nr:hypothetical protein [Fimbriimonadaceae bacterium]